MAWDWLKRVFGGPTKENKSPELPEIPWVAAADTPWGVDVLDVRPITLGMLSTSRDPTCAANAVSFGQDDGTGFIGQEPLVPRRIDAALRFPIDRVLADGVLFIPRAMEHKWALFYHDGSILCVRSWMRQVYVIAQTRADEGAIAITEIQGTFTDDDEPPAFTRRVLDYLLRSHALDLVYPAPLPSGMEKDPGAAALWCMSMFGNRCSFATPHELAPGDPGVPLRSHSLLHLAVARGDVAAVERHLSAGVPVDLLAGDGLSPLHWALACDNPAIMPLLLDRGCPVDVRSDEGATPLMTAVQSASLEKVTFLLDHGADPDARDHRGFTSLHRAAEMGNLEAARALLARGASPAPEAHGHTPRSLAEGRNETEVVALLDSHGATRG